MDRTVTGAGARELAARLASPLTDKNAISARLDAVAWCLERQGIRTGSRETLKGCPDLARALARFFPGRPLRESVLLRDPVGWHVSFYNYRLWRAADRGEPTPPPFEIWLRGQRRNPIARFLLMRYFGIGYPGIYTMSSRARFVFLEDALTQFHFVGGHERCDEAVAGISRDLGVDDRVEPRNVGGGRNVPGELRAKELPDALRMRIETMHALDLLLHRRWKDRGWSGAPAGGAEAALDLPDDDRMIYLRSDAETLWRKKAWR